MPHGLFSFFKKKPARKAVVREERTTTRQESYCNVNELMPEKPAKTLPRLAETLKSTKSKKRFAAPCAPSNPRAEEVTAKHIPKESNAPKAEPLNEEPVRDALSKHNDILEEFQNAADDVKLALPKQKSQSTPDIHMQEVIHYTPQNTISSSRRSPSPDSDMPYVERKSNIILSDKSGLKTIPVSQFDGTISRTHEKRAVAPPPPPPKLSQPVVTNHQSTWSAKNSTSSSSGKIIGKEMVIDAPLPNVSPQQRSAGDGSDDAEIAREFETLKAKFELWKALQTANRNSAEARQLHMEIMYQNESLMKKLQQSADISGHPGRSRPSIASDTFTPWPGNKSQPKLPSSQNPRTSQKKDGRAALSSRWTPTPSSHSLSPATSTSSEETDPSHHSKYEARQSRAVVTDHYTAVAPDKGSLHVQQSSNDDEKTRATLRVVEEANELKRKEQELRRTIGYSVAKETGLPSTSRNFEDHRKPVTTSPSTLPKYHPNRGTSDGNNNSITSQRTAQNIFPERHVPTAPPSRPLNSGPQKSSHSKDYVRGTWNGSLHSSMTSMSMQSEDIVPKKSTRPSPTTAKRSTPLAGSTKDLALVYRINGGILNNEEEPSVVERKLSKPFPAKLPHLRENKLWSPFLEEVQEHINPNPTPNADSNIRKLKEAVKQQSLGHKSASNLLLKTNLSRLQNNQSAKPELSIYTDTEAPSRDEVNRDSSTVRSVYSTDGNVANNISNLIKESPATLRRIGVPVEKSGIRLGKVVEDTVQLDPVTPREVTIGRPKKRENATLPVATIQPPPVAAPSPLAPLPPPPPPPPAVLTAQAPPRASKQRQMSFYPQSQISMRDLKNQRTKLKPPITIEKRVMSADIRDSLMAEIRNAGGIRALKKASREQ